MSAEYGIKLMQTPEEKRPFDGIIVTVKHREYTNYSIEYLKGLCSSNASLIDVKGIYRKDEALKAGLNYWRL